MFEGLNSKYHALMPTPSFHLPTPSLLPAPDRSAHVEVGGSTRAPPCSVQDAVLRENSLWGLDGTNIAIFASFMGPRLSVVEISPRHLSLLDRLSLCNWKTLRLWSYKRNSFFCLFAYFPLPSLPLFTSLCEHLWMRCACVWTCGVGRRNEKWESKIISVPYPVPSRSPNITVLA